MILKERDRRVLALIYEHGFAETKHVQQFFPNYFETRRRLLKFSNFGYIQEETALPRTRVARLTPRGRREVERFYPKLLPQRPHLAQNTFLHDSAVLTARLRLESLWQGTWVPESALPRHEREIPDGIFQFPSGKEFYVEIENSKKAPRRFLSRLHHFPNASLVLYVATSPNLLKLLQRYLSTPDLPPVALVSLDELLASPPPKAWTPLGTSALFSQGQF